ncbi:MAG: outer membrane protein assembly factor, partial [Acidobacteria bacterium]|nr:outer membrane protein assembly factor [Acidobacteriota bacterium]
SGGAQEVSQQDVDISSLRFSSRFDDRDNLFAPHSGNLAELSLEYASAPLGSQLEFFRFHLSAATYFGFGKRTTLAVGLRTGGIYPVRQQDAIPLQERFFSGGENSVRAFRENELLPVGQDGAPLVDEDGNSLGGEAFATFTVELRQLLWGNLEGALFVDSGALVPEAADLFDPFEVRTGAGVGLRYLLPIGPVRLDAAWNTDPGPGEDTFVLHFSVGMAI